MAGLRRPIEYETLSFPSGNLHPAFVMRDDSWNVDDLQHLIGIAFACVALFTFALMIWAGQHQS